MGETRASFRRTSDLIIIFFATVAVIAYILIPYTIPLLAAAVAALCAGVVLVALFVRFIW